MSVQQFCDQCGTICETSDKTEFSGQHLCPSCLERETRTCGQCDGHIWADNDYRDSNCSLCQNGYDRYHSDIQPTANIYGHIDVQRKKELAEAISISPKKPQEEEAEHEKNTESC